MDHMTIDQMEPRRVYFLRSRNLLVGAWNPATQGFIGVREKFRNRYLFTEYHWDTGAPHGTACPVEPAGDLYVPDDMLLAERLPGTWCGDFEGDREAVHVKDVGWFHADDNTQCQSATARGNTALFDLLEPLDAKRAEERRQLWEREGE